MSSMEQDSHSPAFLGSKETGMIKIPWSNSLLQKTKEKPPPPTKSHSRRKTDLWVLVYILLPSTHEGNYRKNYAELCSFWELVRANTWDSSDWPAVPHSLKSLDPNKFILLLFFIFSLPPSFSSSLLFSLYLSYKWDLKEGTDNAEAWTRDSYI